MDSLLTISLGEYSGVEIVLRLTMALTGMMNDGEISRERALELARMILRDNARKLYRLP